MYVPYLKDEKAKIQRFINGFPATYRDQIEFDEPRLLEEAIQKLKRCYEQSKHKVEPKHDLKINEKFKGKWPPKWGRPQGASEKENMVPYKKFNTVEKGHGSQPVNNKIEVMVANRCSVGYVSKIIAGRIFHCNRVV